MPPDDLDTRVRTLEHSHQKLEILIQHLTNAIDEIKNSIKMLWTSEVKWKIILLNLIS